MTLLIIRLTQFYLVVYSMWLVAGIGRRGVWNTRQITTLARAVGLLILSSIGLLASPSLSLALEKYGRPLPSMEQPGGAAALGSRRDLIRGIFSRSRLCIQPDVRCSSR